MHVSTFGIFVIGKYRVPKGGTLQRDGLRTQSRCLATPPTRREQRAYPRGNPTSSRYGLDQASYAPPPEVHPTPHPRRMAAQGWAIEPLRSSRTPGVPGIRVSERHSPDALRRRPAQRGRRLARLLRGLRHLDLGEAGPAPPRRGRRGPCPRHRCGRRSQRTWPPQVPLEERAAEYPRRAWQC